MLGKCSARRERDTEESLAKMEEKKLK